MVGNFEQNENLRQQINEYGYEDVPIWNILVDLKKHLLKENEANYIQQLEKEIKEYSEKHNCNGIYTREFNKLQELKIKLDKAQQQALQGNELAEKIDKALDELYYSRDIRVYNRAYLVALDVLKVVVTEE